MNIEIRQETQSDIEEVFEVNKTVFGRDNEAKFANLLRKGPNFIPELSLIASVNDKIIGHIIFTKILICNDEGKEFDTLALAPMAVKPDMQNKGIGGELIKHGLNKARELGYKSVIVLGHPDYYPKFGFVPAKKWNIKPTFDVPENVFMGIELMKDGLKNISGKVIYPKEFDNV